MKVKVINRSSSQYIRETKNDIHKLPRNNDPSMHPFSLQREHQRALNAVKLDRVFAKPFVGSLDGHSDSVQKLIKHPFKLSTLFSAACNGEIKIWNLTTFHCIKTIKAHDSIVRNVCIPQHGRYFFSVDDSQTIKQWDLSFLNEIVFEMDNEEQVQWLQTDLTPMQTIISKNPLYFMDNHHQKPLLITCGQSVELWEENRTQPLRSWQWGNDSVNYIRFNPIINDVCCAAATDRSLTLYDIRKSRPIEKVIMAMRSNAICWNPLEASIFTVANEDYQLHTFDMRKLNFPLQVHKDHISAVISLDYSSTGREFVSAGYDKTIRIFTSLSRRSRETYHTKRMQRLTDVVWSLDSKFIISSSDEMDIRLWKANASEKLGFKAPREYVNFEYQDKLKKKFAKHPDIHRISKFRHVPKHIKQGQKELQSIEEAQKRK
ncbi:glucose dehydrogenase acceptor-like [Sarcoptes scabiei]|nr:glucose dehydrogenase acceptor-like [Sarcoptes scabiei]